MQYLLTYNIKNFEPNITNLTTKFYKKIQLNSKFNLILFFNYKLSYKENIFFSNEEDFLIIIGDIYEIENKKFDLNKYNITNFFSLLKKQTFSEVLNKIDGDMTLIFFSKEKQKLFFSRDIFGVCPLYYTKKNRKLAISSKPSLIYKNDLSSNLVSKEFVYRYSALHYRMLDNNPEKSPFKEIIQLPSSNLISYDLENDKIYKSKYWNLENISNPSSDDEQELSEIYKSILKESVEKRVAKKKKKIFSISGGLDSSSVLCLASDILNAKVDSFSVTYKDKEYDESKEIQEIVSIRSEKWINVQLQDNIDIEKTLPKIIEINDEPIATATWYAHFLATEKIRESNYDIIYGGLGGDEFNAGEYEYFTFFFADCYLNCPSLLDNEIKFWEKYHNHNIFKKNKDIAFENLRKFTDLKNKGKCLIDKERSFKYLNCIVEQNFSDINLDLNLYCPFDSFLNNRTYHDLFYETLPCCLRAQNRHSSHFDLQTINPFLNRKIAEFMFSVPFNLKIKNGKTKHLLRKAMTNILPESTRKRIKKTGWNAPAHIWFTGKNLELIKEELVSKDFADKGIYSIENVMKVLDQHEKIVKNKIVSENHMMFIWQLINIIQWNKLVDIRL